MKRKLLSLVLALALSVQMLPTIAMAEEIDGGGSPSVVLGDSTLGTSSLDDENSTLGSSSLTPEDGQATVEPVVSLLLSVTEWDGTTATETEPAQEAGTYQIGTAAELAWFRTKVNAGTADANAVLTADIDLGGYNWTPVSNKSAIAEQYSGTFDGQSHAINGLQVAGGTTNQGLFGAINGATIKNLRVSGDVSGSGNYIGGIVGITRNATITNCSFAGTVTSESGYAGGIVGGNKITLSTISGCANMAEVTGSTAGGIMGDSTQSNTIKNCYNSGTITGASQSGGIVGRATAGTITNCYNIGLIEGDSITPGGIYSFSNATIKGCYHLYPEEEKPGGTPTGKSVKITTPQDLEPLLADGAYVDSNGENNGYPLLAWQGSSDTPSAAISLRGDSTIYVEQGAGPNQTTLTLGLTNLAPKEIEAVTWLVETKNGSAEPEDIVDWQPAEDEKHLVVTAKQGGVVSVTAEVVANGEELTATRTISVIPQITTAQVVNVNDNGAVAMGQTVEVEVFVLGGDEYDYDNYPALSYEWRYNSPASSANIPGATAGTYQIPTTGYDEWQYLYVEIRSGGAVVKEAQDVRGQLRSLDYGKLYPVAYDPDFALPDKVKDNNPLTLPATRTVDGTKANITWTSSNTAVITAGGAVTRPASGIAKVTLTAKYTYGTASATKTFDVTVYSDEAGVGGDDKTYLQGAADALGKWYGPMAPAYGKDTNVAKMLEAALADQGYEGIAVAVKSITNTGDSDGIAPNGDLTYFYADPNGSRGLWFGQHRVTFTLTKGTDSLDTPQIAVNLHWDSDKVKETMRSEILSGVTETVVLAQNDASNNVTTDLVLPRVVDGKKWTQVEWSSSDASSVLISSENQGTADTLFDPYVGKVIRGDVDKVVTLTAKFSFNRATPGEPPIALYKTFTFTVRALADDEANALRAELLGKLDAGFAAAGIRDYVTGNQLTLSAGAYSTTNDLQLPTTRDFGVDGKYLPVTIVSSDPDTLVAPDVANAARVTVYRPAVGSAARTVTLTVSLTDLARGVSASREFDIAVLPLTQVEVDDALALMDRAKSAYYEGISAGRYKDEFTVTGGLRPFQEAVWNDDRDGLRWVYDIKEATRNGIVADELDNWAEQEAWRAFRSSDMAVLDHETLNHVAQPAEDTFVRIDSVLTHEVLGKYAGRPEYEGMGQLYRQPVSVYVMVAGKHHPSRTPNELARMREAAIARLSAPISAQLTLRGTRAKARSRAVAAAATMGDTLMQTTVGGLEAGTTVFGLFRKALAEQGYTYKAIGSYIKSVTDADGNTLSERDSGANSGWIYTVNGEMPSIYMNGYSLKEGDEVEVRFTTDYTQESGFGGGGQGGTGGTSPTAPPSTNTGVVGNSRDSSVATESQATAAIAGAATSGGARLVNVTSISPAVARQVAVGLPAGTLIFADTVMGNATIGRMYLDPVTVSKRTGPVDTRIDTTVRGTAAASTIFGAHFANKMVFAQLGQAGSFGMNVRIALRLDLAGMAPTALVAYVYDAASNTYTRLASPSVDRNGFVHVNTTKGGTLVFTDRAMELK